MSGAGNGSGGRRAAVVVDEAVVDAPPPYAPPSPATRRRIQEQRIVTAFQTRTIREQAAIIAAGTYAPGRIDRLGLQLDALRRQNGMLRREVDAHRAAHALLGPHYRHVANAADAERVRRHRVARQQAQRRRQAAAAARPDEEHAAPAGPAIPPPAPQPGLASPTTGLSPQLAQRIADLRILESPRVQQDLRCLQWRQAVLTATVGPVAGPSVHHMAPEAASDRMDVDGESSSSGDGGASSTAATSEDVPLAALQEQPRSRWSPDTDSSPGSGRPRKRVRFCDDTPCRRGLSP